MQSKQIKRLPANYIKHSTDGEFTLMVNSPIYRTKITEQGYYLNTKTGENCGQKVDLHVFLCDGLDIFDEPIFEEDCYELIQE